MSLSHRGTGTIDVGIGSGATIDTLGEGNRGAGLWLSRSGDGDIDVENSGTIRSAGHDGIFVLNEADGAITIRHLAVGSVNAAGNGIYVRQGSGGMKGNGAVSVTSGGDITTTGPTGINLDLNRGVAGASAPVTLNLTGGAIRAAGTGLQVNSRATGGIDFDMSGVASIGTSDAPIGQTGVSLGLLNTGNAGDLDVNLTAGTIHAVHRGLSLAHVGSGAIGVVLGTDSAITTRNSLTPIPDRRTLTRGAGLVADHSGTGYLNISGRGTIRAGAGGGIYARHSGTGALTISHSGTITAGFQGIDARRTGRGGLAVAHNAFASITASRGPGIFVRHDAPRSGIRKHDVDVTVAGDVTTTSPGHAAVHVYKRGESANAGVRVRHTSGTLTGFGGITVNDARYTGSTSGMWTGAPWLGYDRDHRPVIDIEVSGTARIVARGPTAGGTLPEVDRLVRSLVGTTGGTPRGITVGGGDYARVGRFIAEGDGDIALTQPERAVVNAVYGTGDLDAALSALDSATYGDDYRNTVRWYAGAHNDADFRVDVQSGGAIESEGDGIRLIRRHLSDRNGGSVVTVKSGARVKAARHGIRMRGAGRPENGIRAQTVSVEGLVESTGSTGAAVALLGGGYVSIGPRGSLEAASGAAVMVDDPDPPAPGVPASCRVAEATDGLCPDGYMGNGGANLSVTVNKRADEDMAVAFVRALGEGGRIVNPGGATRLRVNDDTDGGVRLVPVRMAVTPPPPPPGPDPVTPVDPGTEPTPGGGGSGSGGTGGTGPTVPQPRPGPSAGDTDRETWLTLAPGPADRMVSGAHGAWMDCDGSSCALRTVMEPRARVYAALPSVLLDMVGGGTDFLSAALEAPSSAPALPHGVTGSPHVSRAGDTGAWASAASSSVARSSGGPGSGASHTLNRRGLSLGHDAETFRGGTLGLSVSRLSGNADVGGGGDIGVTATVVGVTHRWDLPSVTVSARASAASMSAGLSSPLRGPLGSGVSGSGISAGIGAAFAVTLPDAALALGAGLAHARVSADGFTSFLRDSTGGAAVPVSDIGGEETALRLRADWRRPTASGGMFLGGELDVPLGGGTGARAGSTPLHSDRRTGVRLHGGLALDRPGGKSAVLSLSYAGDSGGGAVRAGLALGF